MKKTYQYQSLQWIDFLKPTEAELRQTVGNSIDKDIIDDLLSPTARHNVSIRQNHAYLVLHFPAFKDSDSDAAYELDFVVGKDFLITVHYKEIIALNEFAATVYDGGNVLFGLLQALIADFDSKLSKIDHWVRDLEKNMFAGKEKHTIFELSEASRHLIDFRKITSVYPESLKELAVKGRELFGQEFANEAIETLNVFEHAQAKLEVLSEAVKELRETNASILSTKQNETMKMLTAVTIIATILVGIALVWVGLLAI